MGQVQQAEDEYKKALETANLSVSLAHGDIPAVYAAADAYLGLGDANAAEARKARETAARVRLFKEARSFYEKSLDTWKQVANPSSMNGNDYTVLTGSKPITARLALLPQ
jgi:tetratricopeptide (TPR) repeat protein